MSNKKTPGFSQLLLTGVVMIIFGVIALASPLLAGMAVVYVIGGVLIVAGLFQLFQGFKLESFSSKLFSLIFGAIAILGGIGVIADPLLGLGILTWLIAFFFLVEGVWKIIASFSFRPASGWIAILLSGVLALVLGGLIFNNWPSSEAWAVGVLVGVDLLVTGASMVALAITVRQLANA